jgi:Butirosin biosynthesis protein H, N-terminal/Domain of unknown function (DUF4872)
MDKFICLPHRTAHGMCPVNGVRDLIQWRTGRDWSNEFVFGLGQGGGFAYLRFNFADPPRQIYWGTSSSRQHKYLADLLEAGYFECENRSFKYAWKKAGEMLDSGTPPVIGPLDMFYLKFYEELYLQRHIPIHYLLLAGYDDQNAYVYETDHLEVQEVPLNELELAWDVNVPGLGKRNRLVALDVPSDIHLDETLICRSIKDECQMMLMPPVSMIGIPAMEKVAREITGWPRELGEEVTRRCLLQVREYLSSPPDVLGSHLTAGRDIYLTFLREAAALAGLDFHLPLEEFGKAMDKIPLVAEAIQQNDLEKISEEFTQIAIFEKKAFTSLLAAVEPN